MVEPRYVEERMVRRGEISMRLIINRRHRHIRFMDFRVGNYEEKRAILDAVAHQEKLQKVFTLVEKQDSQNWRQAEFVREGVYPSFFRTADAYVMSRLYDAAGNPLHPTGSDRPATDTAPDHAGVTPPSNGIKVDVVLDRRGIASALQGIDGELTALPFGRVGAPDMVLQARTRRRTGWACAEIDDSFGHAVVAFSTPPAGDPDGLSVALAGQLLESLEAKGVANIFAVIGSDEAVLAELFNGLGFRVTGRLAQHLCTADGQGQAVVWHRRVGFGR